MKALPFKIPRNADCSISLEHDRMEHFYAALHTHTELQLTLITEGRGTAYIGDRIEQFEPDDVFLLGPDLPHVFRDQSPARKSKIESFSIFFLPDFFGKGFLEIPETRAINQLFDLSLRGLKFNNDLKHRLTMDIKILFDKTGLERLQSLVSMLENITQSNQFDVLASPGFQKPRNNADGQKINDVFDFLVKNHTRTIKLDEVANIAHMSPTAFCRYFKQHTRKTYSQFLNEIRVGQACKLIIDDNSTIAQVCYLTGFNNISNFNRQFKKITGYTPRDYIKEQLQQI